MEPSKKSRGNSVLLAGAVLQLFFGVIYVWSVFVMPVSEHFNWGAESVKLTSSFMLCCFVLGILFGGRLQVKFGTSRVVFCGGLLMAIGMLVTSFIPGAAPWIIYISYGVFGGFGVGMAYNAIITSAQKWFPAKRGMATGISVCMFGFSTVVFAPLVEALIARFELIATFRILAAAFAVVTLALFRFIVLPTEADAPAMPQGMTAQKQYTTGEIIKTKQFYFIAVSLMLMTAPYFIMNPSFKTLAGEREISSAVATGIVMMTGVTNACGRLLVPMAAQKFGRENAIGGIIILTALSSGCLIFAKGALFMICVGITAFCYGGSSGAYPLITGDYFGLENLGSNYGAVMVGFASAALLFPMAFTPITNTGVKFAILAALSLLGVFMMMALVRGRKAEEKAN